MSDPSVYFPSTLAVKLGFTHPGQWSTLVSTAPNGRTQRRQMWPYRKRGLSFTVWVPDPGAMATLRNFLRDNAGRYRRFWCFDPTPENFVKDPQPALVYASFPLTLPFLGGTITEIYINGTPTYSDPADFTVDNGGSGGEIRLTNTGTTPTPGDLIQVDIKGARQRIPVINLQDVDAMGFDWTAAIPPQEVQLSFIEDRG